MFCKTVSQSKQYAINLTFHVTADLQLLNSNASRPYRVLVSYTLKDWECWNSSTRTVFQCHTSLRVGNIGLQVPVPYFSVIQVRGLVMLECKYAVPCLVSYKLESWECWNASTRTVFQCHTSQRVGNVGMQIRRTVFSVIQVRELGMLEYKYPYRILVSYKSESWEC